MKKVLSALLVGMVLTFPAHSYKDINYTNSNTEMGPDTSESQAEPDCE